MFKSHVPVCLCSLAFMITMPSTANPGPVPGQEKLAASSSHGGRKSPSKNSKKIALAPPNQQGMNFVHRYIRGNDEDLLVIKRRSEVPFTIIDSVLTRYNLPLELKYLAVIESDLKTGATSRVGAKGPWQFTRSTAHSLGLHVNQRVDDRMNYYKSTRAAAKYLRDLHHQFGDWLLVLAAYNGGPRPVYRAIRKAHSRDFWVLQRYLPAESRLHVKRFIATAYYFEGAQNIAGATTATATPTYAVAKVPIKGQQGAEDGKFHQLVKQTAGSLDNLH